MPAAAAQPGSHHHLEIDVTNAGRRLDGVLRRLYPEASWATLMRWLRDGGVRVDGRRVRRGDHRLVTGAWLRLPRALPAAWCAVPPPVVAPARRNAAAMGLDLVHEDDHLLVVNKPAGLACQPGSGHSSDSLWHRACAYLGATDALPGHRPGLVQRLDRDVSGLVLVGKDAPTLRGLSALAAAGQLHKVYLAAVVGVVAEAGSICLPLAIYRGPEVRRRRAVPAADGVAAHTDYWVRAQGAQVTLLEVRLRTGRMHQIRAHLAAIGHPLLGDRRYGDPRGAFAELGRPFLHAESVDMPHPCGGQPLRLRAPLPAPLAAICRELSRS